MIKRILPIAILSFLMLSAIQPITVLAVSDACKNCQENFDYDRNQEDYDACLKQYCGSTDNTSQNTAATDNSVYKFTANQPIGTFTGGNVNENLLGNYIRAWYDLMLAVIGMVATIMIVWAGFKWLLARGDSGKISDAKAIIFSALSGMALALLSYTLLIIINPRLVNPSIDELKPIQVPSAATNTFTSTADGAGYKDDLTKYPINQQDQEKNVAALKIYNINVAQGVRVDGLDPAILDTAANIAQNSGETPVITSACRPGDGTSLHASCAALDFGASHNNDDFFLYMDRMTDGIEGVPDPKNPNWIIYNNVQFLEGTTGRIIKEYRGSGRTSKDIVTYHIDHGR